MRTERIEKPRVLRVGKEEHWNDLTRVIAPRGTGTIIVHPFTESFGKVTPYPDYPQGEYESKLAKLSKKSQLVVFEEEEAIQQTHDKLKQMGFGNLFFVPTRTNCPDPVEGWMPVLTRLKEAGLKKAVVGGKYATEVRMLRSNDPVSHLVSHTELRKLLDKQRKGSFVIGYCVGATMEQLVYHGIKIGLNTGIIYPMRTQRKQTARVSALPEQRR